MRANFLPLNCARDVVQPPCASWLNFGSSHFSHFLLKYCSRSLTACQPMTSYISCTRLYSLLSDPRAWSSLVWKNCRNRDQDFKALRLAVTLSHSYVTFLIIMTKLNTTIIPEIGTADSAVCHSHMHLTRGKSGGLCLWQAKCNKIVEQLHVPLKTYT